MVFSWQRCQLKKQPHLCTRHAALEPEFARALQPATMSDFQRQLRELGLVLDQRQLVHNKRSLQQRLLEGLAGHDAQVAMLPAYLAPAADDLAGLAVAVDSGGTHLRAARVRLSPAGRAVLTSEPVTTPLPGAAGTPAVEAEQFFAAHARLLEQLEVFPEFYLGYCFSYPITCQPSGDAILNKWTKEVRVSGVEGQAVGSLLREYLRRVGIEPSRVVVLNDTIAALLGGSLSPQVSSQRCIGLIVGTGHNMGAYVPRDRIGKLAGLSWPHEAMAVNFESGAFDCPVLGEIDEQVDASSARPGRQRFEKAVAGAYLGRLFSAAAGTLGLADRGQVVSAKEVSKYAAEPANAPLNRLARALIERAADLVASAIAATDELFVGQGPLYVCAEGSLFWRGPGFSDRVRQTVAAMLAKSGRSAQCRLVATPHANLLGSAVAALSRRDLHFALS